MNQVALLSRSSLVELARVVDYWVMSAKHEGTIQHAHDHRVLGQVVVVKRHAAPLLEMCRAGRSSPLH